MTQHRRINGLAGDERGVAAIEFAVMAPFLMLIWLGAVEACALLQASDKTLSAAYTVADLTAQGTTQTQANLNSIVSAAQQVMSPLPTTLGPLSIAVASVTFDAITGKPATAWTFTAGNQAPAIDPTIANNLGGPGASVIITKVKYTYQSYITFLENQMTFNETAISRPRFVNQIPLN
jgi:Flp pilus assembly protein TadG